MSSLALESLVATEISTTVLLGCHGDTYHGLTSPFSCPTHPWWLWPSQEALGKLLAHAGRESESGLGSAGSHYLETWLVGC